MDCLIIGCGLSGAVIARELAEQGKKVVIWEQRDHIGGNMYDYIDEHGILVQKYGPHTFHTTKKELYEYMCRFADWQTYDLTCGAEIDGKYTPTPFNFKTIDDFHTEKDAIELKLRIKTAFGDRKTATVTEVLEHSDEMIRGYAEFLFAKDYSLYTAKQWGVDPSKVDPSILKRVPLRFSYDEGYFDDEFQVMPKTKFSDFFVNILNHPNIEVKLETDALEHINIRENGLLVDGVPVDYPVVYTGALDALFGGVSGALPYRSLRFEWHHESIQRKQAYPVVAYPQAEGYTRITEYNQLPVQNTNGTTYAVEYPLHYEPNTNQEPYYPLLTEESQTNYQKYAELASTVPNLYCCGRLADFKYYNMDQALERALNLCTQLIF